MSRHGAFAGTSSLPVTPRVAGPVAREIPATSSAPFVDKVPLTDIVVAATMLITPSAARVAEPEITEAPTETFLATEDKDACADTALFARTLSLPVALRVAGPDTALFAETLSLAVTLRVAGPVVREAPETSFFPTVDNEAWAEKEAAAKDVLAALALSAPLALTETDPKWVCPALGVDRGVSLSELNPNIYYDALVSYTSALMVIAFEEELFTAYTLNPLALTGISTVFLAGSSELVSKVVTCIA